MADKAVKVGTKLQTKTGKETLKLGNDNPNSPKFNYTVQVRVYEGTPKTKEDFKTAKVLGTFTNPWITMTDPHENAPKAILKELSIWTNEEN